MKTWRLTAAALTLALAGCGGGDITTWLGSYTKEKPAELVPLTNEATIGTLWTANVGPGGAGKGARLKPQIDGGTLYAADAKGRVTTGASLASADLPTYTGTDRPYNLTGTGGGGERSGGFDRSGGDRTAVTTYVEEER